MDLVLPPLLGDAYPLLRSVRLFYVAMTRARTAAYLVTDALRPSGFALELRRESSLVRQIGELAWKCPRCPSGRLLPSQSQGNLRCSNYPHCRHLSPRCPGCGEGYSVVSERHMPSACTEPDLRSSPGRLPWVWPWRPALETGKERTLLGVLRIPLRAIVHVHGEPRGQLHRLSNVTPHLDQEDDVTTNGRQPEQSLTNPWAVSLRG